MRIPQQQVSKRKRRRDAGKKRLNDRDVFALTWIGQQYAIRLDQLQWVLGRFPGHGARHPDWISESSARDAVDRWEQMGYIRAQGIRDKQPFWIWLTRKALTKIGLPYVYRDLKESSLDAVDHLYAINAIRLHLEAVCPDMHWTSERALLRGRIRLKGKTFLHRADGIATYADGEKVAIEGELSTKKPFELAENLLELLRGEDYLSSKIDVGWQTARWMSRGDRSQYDKIWYFAPEKVRKQVRRVRARLLEEEVISEEEAERIYVYWYPLALKDEELAQEEREDDEALGLETQDEGEDDEGNS